MRWTGVLWGIVILALASQVLTLLIAGHAAYLWVQGVQAIATSVGLLIFGLRFLRRDPRASAFPPLLPLAAVAMTGGVKDIYVAVGAATPPWLILVFLVAVGWFFAVSWVIWRREWSRRR